MATINEAFHIIHRADFLPEAMHDQAGIDMPLPIGFGQTNSQPSTVHRMLEWLGTEESERVLDVGSGSGWTAALLATIVGPSGHVSAVERIPELVAFGRDNCRRLAVKNVHFFQAGRDYGLPERAPFDRILVSAAAQELPAELLQQLKVGGKLVIPIQHNILEITKMTDIDYETIPHPGFVFVPLI